ncbi:MAG TPA: efflux RND transporter periplasmic adaptor subunit [Vicinamibacterales bacterium]|nr:efflux RND transporter periplasmic adaptor subunit [Vicinamibacterales bacterium]
MKVQASKGPRGQGFGPRVQGFGPRVQGSGPRVQGSGQKVRWFLAWIAFVLSASCARPALEEAETTAAVPVEVEAAKMDAIQTTIDVTGTVSPASGADWVITAPAPARIAAIDKIEGDRVGAGDVLVRFDIPTLAADVAARKAAVAQATARLNLAKAAVARLSGLVTQGVAARKEVEEAQREQLDADAALAQAHSELQAAESLADRAVVRARFAGVVAKRWHNVGDIVDASTTDPVLRVIDPNHLQVMAAVPVADLQRIQVGHAVKIVGPAGGEGEEAVVAAKPAQVETGSATADVRVTFTHGSTLTVGTPVEVHIVAEERQNTLVIPAAAVVHDGDETFVFVAGSDNKAHKTAVTLGVQTRELAEVKAGIKAGDSVITKGQDGLPDGAAISIEK